MISISLNNISASYQTKSVKKGRYRLNRLINFGAVYSETFIFNNISLFLSEGDVVAIKGASGSGKTTLMRLILGCSDPVNGSIIISGSLHGMLDLNIIEHKSTGIQNIILNGLRSGFNGTDLSFYKKNIVNKIDKPSLLNQPFHVLPKDIRNQLIENIRIENMKSPDICLVDLPHMINNEDITKEIIKKSKLVVFSTNNDEIIKKYCNRVINLDNDPPYNLEQP